MNLWKNFNDDGIFHIIIYFCGGKLCNKNDFKNEFKNNHFIIDIKIGTSISSS